MESAAEKLRRYRASRRLTGEGLGKRLGVSKGTVSKLENGQLPISLDYLSRFCHELRLTDGQTRELMQLASVIPSDARPTEFLQLLPFDFVSTDWSRRSQQNIAVWEQRASTIWVYQPHIVPGLLQIPEYAAETLKTAGIKGDKALSRAVNSRVKRQHILGSNEKSFCFLIAEAALHALSSRGSTNRAALKHIAQFTSTSSNVTVGIVPLGARIHAFPPPAFYLFDNARVYLELPHGDLFLMQASVAETYSKLFESLRLSARFGVSASAIIAAAASSHSE